ncbi:hypothetical protein CG392_06645 [Gardnerella vaginalis]|nr:hypothetical protein CG392_06645 [Gardnerella vaginalis]
MTLLRIRTPIFVTVLHEFHSIVKIMNNTYTNVGIITSDDMMSDGLIRNINAFLINFHKNIHIFIEI